MDGLLVDNLAGLCLFDNISKEEFLERRKVFDAVPDKPFDFVIDRIRAHLFTNLCFINIPPLPEFYVFLDLIQFWISQGKSVQILSSGTRHEDIFSEICRQKTIWSDHHHLRILPKNYAKGSKDKIRWAREGVLLLDDHEANIKRFTKAGGHAIRHTNIHNTLLELEKYGLCPNTNRS